MCFHGDCVSMVILPHCTLFAIIVLLGEVELLDNGHSNTDYQCICSRHGLKHVCCTYTPSYICMYVVMFVCYSRVINLRLWWSVKMLQVMRWTGYVPQEMQDIEQAMLA